MDVSILVLMEVVKEHIFHTYNPPEKLSFNPCFNGSCKRTRTGLLYNINIKHVSILVLMEVVKEQFEKIFEPPWVGEFQSLF